MEFSSVPISVPAGLLACWTLFNWSGICTETKQLAAPESSVRVLAPELDLGRLKPGQILEFQWGFTNSTSSDLDITRLVPSCSCVQVGHFSSRVGPNQGGFFSTKFLAGGIPGPIRESVLMFGTDTNRPIGRVLVRAEVWVPIEARPQFVTIKVPRNRTNEMTAVVSITNHLAELVNISAPVCHHPAFTAELITNRVGRDYALQIHARAPMGSGNCYGRITMNTTCQEMPILEVTAFIPAEAPPSAARPK
jgi:hypothetical protein